MTSVADIIIGIGTSILSSFSAVLPAEYSALPISDFNNSFLGVAQNISTAYNSIDWLCPAWLIISVLSIILIAEVALLVYKAGVMITNVIRGSGA